MDENSGETLVSSGAPRSVTLTMKQGPSPGQKFTASKDTITIGRLSDNDISISNQEVSRHHATITWENNQFVIRDLGGPNGTTVNGSRITAPCPLRDGDVIGLGTITLVFTSGTGLASSDETYSRPASAPAPAAPVTSAPIQPLAIPMSARAKKSDTALWVGIGLVVILGLIVVASLLVFFVFQSQAGPKVTVQEPLTGSKVQIGQPVTVLALVKDVKGVSRVEFWVNNALEATIPSGSPEGQKEFLVQHSWIPDSNGPCTLSLRGFNVAGKVGEPFEVTVDVTGSAPTGTATSTSVLEVTPSTPLVIPTSTTASTIASCVNDAAFVADVTVPDNSVFPPDTKIDKTWRIRNSGTCPWQTGYQLVFASGDKMGAPDSQVVVPTAPGGTTDVTVTMYAPSVPGIYKGFWRMVSNVGEAFGQSMTVLIQVPSPTLTVSPTTTAFVQLTADSTSVNAGDCTMVRATVQNVSAAWLDGEPVVGGYKEKQVCPCSNTTYTLDAMTTSGEHIIRNVIVNVAGACTAPPTSTTDLDAWKTLAAGLHETPTLDTGAFLTQMAKPKITPRLH